MQAPPRPFHQGWELVFDPSLTISVSPAYAGRPIAHFLTAFGHSRGLRLLVAVGVLGLTSLWGNGAGAQEKSYWLTRGGQVIGSCPGSREGRPLRAANSDHHWVLLEAVLTCRDENDA